MQHREALMKLMTALRIIGVNDDDMRVEAEKDGFQVTCDYIHGNRITVFVSEFWRYPGLSCYFVNFAHPGGNFMANVGTPHIEQALVDFGTCLNSFVMSTEVAHG